ncbi:MAG: OstA-like protein [Crocinitomicaceae bacterium]
MTNNSHCQSRFDKKKDVVKLIFAETVTNSDKYKNTTKAVGNVHFEHNQTNLYCDSALFFRDKDLVHAYGKVHINQGDTINLFCDSLKYDGNTKISRLQGNVRMRDNAYKLVTDSLDYNGNNSTGRYLRNAVITTIKDDLKLTSVKGYYHANQKTFFFKDSVRMTHPNFKLIADTLEFRTNSNTAHFHGPTQILMDSTEVQCVKGVYYTSEQKCHLWNGATVIDSNKTFYADSMFYDQNTGIGEGFDNVNLYDSTENVQFLSNYMWKSAENDTLILKSDATLLQFNQSDTLELQADSIYYFKDTLTDLNTSVAQNNVGIINGDLTVRCDSAFFSEKDSIIKFHKNPVMWSQNTQMSADSILTTYYAKEFHEVYLHQNAFITSEHDSLHYDQIKGKEMTAWMDSSKIQKVYIESNAESIYYIKETEQDTLNQDVDIVTGMNHIDCNEIFIYFVESEIDRIKFVEQPNATYFPIEAVIQKDRFLKGFKWQIGLKPTSIFGE